MPLAPAVYHKGNVRLLHPVVLPDDHPMTVFYDEPAAKTELQPLPAAEVPNRPAPVVPDLDDYPDLGEDTYEYTAPPKPTRTVMVTFVDGGPRPAPLVPEE